MDIENMNAIQKEALQQFKKETNEFLTDNMTDRYLTKWLIARNFHVQKATNMFKKSMEWRKKVGADSLLDWEPPLVLQRYYGGGYCGFDKEGYPVRFDLLGAMDHQGMYHSVKKSDALLYEARQMERCIVIMTEQSEKIGRIIDQETLIMDLDQLSMTSLNATLISWFNELMQMSEDNYPEILRRCFIINAPRIFPFLYNMVKPFLSQETQDKVHILGGNWKDELQTYIDADQIPVHWGGTRRDSDGDPCCKSMICIPQKVPEEMYLKNQLDISGIHLTTTTVEKGQLFRIPLDVHKTGTMIKWMFTTEYYDISFGIQRVHRLRCDETEYVDALPLERINSHVLPQDGVFVCEQPGQYMATFDNSYSWMNSKQLQYNVELVLPNSNT